MFRCWMLAAAHFTLLASAAAAPPQRPNIVLILADDMGFSDLGCYGSEISTPHLDRLAKNGLRFTQFYNTGRCCPTRASLLTGLYPHQAGVGHMVEDRGLPAYRGRLNDRCVTIAEALGAGGYHALMCGKWHVGENRPHWPADRGFEKYFGLISGATSYFRLDSGRIMALDGRPYVPPVEGFYLTDAITDHAVALMEEFGRRPEPFFLYLAYTAPHWPLHARAEDIARYRGKYLEGWDALREKRHRRLVELGIIDRSWAPAPRDPKAPEWAGAKDKELWDLKMAVYAAQIDRMDQGIGRILEKLKELDAEENTLVLFLSDNGGCAEQVDRGQAGAPPGTKESFLSYGLPWANASNTPFRLFKHWVHEGGIATPLIARWPAVIRQPGSITHQPGHLIDLMATCLEAAGIEYPKAYAGRELIPLEGKSLLPIFRGEIRAGHAAIFWEHEGNRAVRQGKWKLVARHGKDWEMHDLEADRTELADLSARFPDKAADLARLYGQWAERCGVEPWEKVQAIEARSPLELYFIDTEGGAATLIVTPLRESILVDSGNPGERDAGRIAHVVKQAAGLQRIDHCITTHWHRDHTGGIARLAELVPVERFYDHGLPVAPAPDISPSDLEAYRRASKGKSTALKAGDALPLRSVDSLPRLELRVVAADGLVAGEPAGAPQVGPCERGHPARPEDGSDNARSIAFLLTFGDFQFFDGGDLTWNVEHKLACPRDRVGPADVFQVDHHGLDLSNNPALVEALKPRAAIINNGPRKGGEAGTFATLKGTPGLEAIFQLHRNLRAGDSENAPPEHIANDGENCSAEHIRLSVDPNGKFYTVTLPGRGTCRTFETR